MRYWDKMDVVCAEVWGWVVARLFWFGFGFGLGVMLVIMFRRK